MDTRSFYGADDRLRAFQKYDDQTGSIQSTSAGVWEEYRYDPLGRRVAVRTLRPTGLCNQPAECYNSTTYFVWAGDQILWELRSTTASAPEETRGQVSYFHAGGIDRPLTIWKSGVGSVVTHQNWRGQLARGTYGVDNAARVGQGTECPEYPATNCVPVAWPGWNTRAWNEEAAKPNTTGDASYFFGSLAVGMRDASGMLYMRNRYYDPQTGQFTQPDPIGLAGGLNSYGFAAGDPVSYSDPYGLSVCTDPPCRSEDDPMRDRPLPSGVDENDVTWDPDNGWYVHDTDGRIIRPHPEDQGHWDHWEVYPGRGGRPAGQGADFPERSQKPWPGQRRPPYGKQSPTDPWRDVPGATFYRWRARVEDGARTGRDAFLRGADRVLDGLESIDPTWLLPPLPGLSPLLVP